MSNLRELIDELVDARDDSDELENQIKILEDKLQALKDSRDEAMVKLCKVVRALNALVPDPPSEEEFSTPDSPAAQAWTSSN